MGAVKAQSSHKAGSSSMFFALRWKHENLKVVSLVSLGAMLIMVMFAILLYGTALKSVILVVNGEEKTLHTTEWRLDRLLAEQGLTPGEHDRVSASMDSRLKQGERIEIDQAVPVQLTADGKTEKRYTIGRTVQSALQDLGVSLGKYDKVFPALNSPLEADAAVTVVRVKKVLVSRNQEIPFQVVQQKDGKLAKGKEKLVRQGQPGVRVDMLEKTYEDGKLTAVSVLDSSVQRESIDKVVAVGIKKPITILSASSPVVEEVTKKGVTFGVKQILKNVILTAYDAGFESTGKTPSHPQYGITYTGTKVQEGRTIAVDPKVIPLGWWVYIEGYGFRKAEDIGSGIKGKWIDIYVGDGNYANRFGLRRGATVYVIGPTMPAPE